MDVYGVTKAWKTRQQLTCCLQELGNQGFARMRINFFKKKGGVPIFTQLFYYPDGSTKIRTVLSIVLFSLNFLDWLNRNINKPPSPPIPIFYKDFQGLRIKLFFIFVSQVPEHWGTRKFYCANLLLPSRISRHVQPKSLFFYDHFYSPPPSSDRLRGAICCSNFPYLIILGIQRI